MGFQIEAMNNYIFVTVDAASQAQIDSARWCTRIRRMEGYRVTAITVATVPTTESARVRKVSQANPSSSGFTGT